MDSLIYGLNGTVPIFAVMILGYLLKKQGMFTEEFTSVANKYVFKISLPVMVFLDMWKEDIGKNFDAKFVCFCLFSTVICFTIIWIGAEIGFKDKTQIGAFVQGSFRSSAAVLGLSFIKNIYHDVGLAPLMIVGAVPFYNVASVVVLTFRGKEKNESGGIKKALIGIVKNPIIIAILLGCIASLIHLPKFAIVTKSLEIVSNTATPVALLAIGAGFEFTSAATRIKPTIIGSIIKLIIQPLVFIPIAYLLGFRDQEMLAILIMLAGPATVSGYVMAKIMNNDDVLASGIVVVSTLLSAFTLTTWICVLRSIGCLM